MGKTKILPELIFDFLCYLNRDDLDRLTLVCRLLNSFVERYFHLTPYRIFDGMYIYGGNYGLMRSIPKHKRINGNSVAYWHPNRDDYTVKQFLAGEVLSAEGHLLPSFYSYAEMSPYLGPNIRAKHTVVHSYRSISLSKIFSELESLTHVWRQHKLHLTQNYQAYWNADDLQPLLKSPTALLQCQYLRLDFGDFPLKDYEVLYSVKVINISYLFDPEHVKYWIQFLETEGVKPLLVLPYEYCRLDDDDVEVNVVDFFFQAFSNATSPSSFKVELVRFDDHEVDLDERRKYGKKGSMEYIGKCYDRNEVYYTLERYSI